MAEHSRDARRMVQGRQKARRFAMQALYQWQIAGQDLRDIEKHFLEEQDMGNADTAYFHELVHDVPKHIDTLDALLSPALARPIAEVDPVEQAILRMAAYELQYRLDVPYRVVINEAVQLAKTFGAEQSHKFINGVLDKLAKKIRTVETGRRS